MKKKKLLSVLILGILTISTLVACSRNGNSSSSVPTVDYDQNAFGSWFPFGTELKGDDEVADNLIPATTHLNPSEVYANIEYTPQLFYGTHGKYGYIDGKYNSSNPGDDFYNSVAWMNMKDFIGFEHFAYPSDKYLISAVPFIFSAGGATNVDFDLSKITDHEWCKLYYGLKDINNGSFTYITIDAAFEVDGDELVIKPLSDIGRENIDTTGVITYTFSGKEIRYKYQFSAFNLTLSKENTSVTLLETAFYSTNPGSNSYTGNGTYAAFNKPIPDIDSIFISYHEDSHNLDFLHVTYGPDNEDLNYESFTNMACKIHDNGIIQFAFQDKKGNIHEYEYVFFPLGNTGVAFSDGTNTYIYLDDFIDFIHEEYDNVTGLNVSPEDEERLASLEQEDIQLLEETKEHLLSEFSAELGKLGVQIIVDSKTGEILFDSSILFDKNESTISEEGKVALENFSKVFSEILGKDEYRNFISQVVIQGHTDSDGDYDYNKKLSQERADAVKECILNALADDAEATALCESLFQTEGCASDYLIYDETGAEDKEASRRVVFVFYVDLDYLDN